MKIVWCLVCLVCQKIYDLDMINMLRGTRRMGCVKFSFKAKLIDWSNEIKIFEYNWESSYLREGPPKTNWAGLVLYKFFGFSNTGIIPPIVSKTHKYKKDSSWTDPFITYLKETGQSWEINSMKVVFCLLKQPIAIFFLKNVYVSSGSISGINLTLREAVIHHPRGSNSRSKGQ